MKILIVDDELDIVEVLSELLSDYHEVKSTVDSTRVMDMLADYQPDILITDYNMPTINGRELADWAYANQGVDSIIITGDTDVSFDSQHIRMLYKPMNFRKLLEIIST